MKSCTSRYKKEIEPNNFDKIYDLLMHWKEKTKVNN